MAEKVEKDEQEERGEEIEEQDAELLPDREALSVISPGPLAPGSADYPLPSE